MLRRLWPLLLLTSANMAAAQSASLEWMPVAGAFVPAADLAQAEIDGANVAISQKPGAIAGARLVAWWSRRVGFEGHYGYAFSQGRAKSGSGGDVCVQDSSLVCSANVWFASTKLLFRFAPRSYRGWYVFGGLGLAVVGHTGDFWPTKGAVTDLGGVLNVGGVVDISKRFGVRLDVEDYLYSFKLRVEDDPQLGTFELQGHTQNDLVFTVGMLWRLTVY